MESALALEQPASVERSLPDQMVPGNGNGNVLAGSLVSHIGMYLSDLLFCAIKSPSLWNRVTKQGQQRDDLTLSTSLSPLGDSGVAGFLLSALPAVGIIGMFPGMLLDERCTT